MKPLIHRRATSRPLIKAATAVAALSLALAACGSDDDDSDPGTTPGGDTEEIDTEAEVTISFSNFPPEEKPEVRANVERVAQEFMDLHPNVTLEGQEVQWEPQTFNAMLAGGTMPTVMRVPLTEMQRIMALEQAKDVTDAVADNEVLSSLNPALMANATNDDGRIYGIPSGAYSLGLVYNRDLFEQAGLDPDNPPETWEDVRAAAKVIADETGETGLAVMTKENQGGWILSGLTYAHGGELEAPEGDSYTVIATNDGTMAALDLLKSLRWEDNSMGDNFLLNQEEIRTEFAAGRLGMYIGGADAYNDIVNNRGLPPENFGVGSMPQADGGIGTLTGGQIELVKPDVSPEEEYWATQWIQYRELRGRYDQDIAVDNAKARLADDLTVGTPELPLVDRATEDQYLEWIDEYINVNRDHFAPYLETVDTMPLVPEPPANAQDLYAALDPVVQAALTDEGADLEGMLEQVESDVNALIAQSQ